MKKKNKWRCLWGWKRAVPNAADVWNQTLKNWLDTIVFRWLHNTES